MKQKVAISLSPDTVRAICRVVYAGTAQLRQELGQSGGLPWDVLPERTKIEIELGVRDINSGKVKQPADLHRIWRDEAVKQGWTHGLVKDEEMRKHPAICAFDELPTMEQAKFNLFYAMAATLVFSYTKRAYMEGGQS